MYIVLRLAFIIRLFPEVVRSDDFPVVSAAVELRKIRRKSVSRELVEFKLYERIIYNRIGIFLGQIIYKNSVALFLELYRSAVHERNLLRLVHKAGKSHFSVARCPDFVPHINRCAL